MPKQGQKSADGGSAECDDCKFQGGNSSKCGDAIDKKSVGAKVFGWLSFWSGAGTILQAGVEVWKGADWLLNKAGNVFNKDDWHLRGNEGTDVQYNVDHLWQGDDSNNCTRTCWNMWEEVDED